MKKTLIATTILALSLAQPLSSKADGEIYLEEEITLAEAGRAYIAQLHSGYDDAYGKILYTSIEDNTQPEKERCTEVHGMSINQGEKLFVASSTHIYEGKIQYHRLDIRAFPESFETYACTTVNGIGADLVQATANALENAITNRAPATTSPLGFIDGETKEQTLAGAVSTKVGLISSYKETFSMETAEGAYTSLNVCFGAPIQQNIVPEKNKKKKEKSLGVSLGVSLES